MTTARKFPPLKTMRFRTEACLTGRVTGSLPIPLRLDGTLDDAFAAMAEEGEMTADEYKTYYQNGYKTDITNIDIEGDHIEFTYEDGKKVGSDYKYVGYYIQNWSTGTKRPCTASRRRTRIPVRRSTSSLTTI